MDFGIRELLMLIGALIFVGILFDGVRRFKENRSKQIKLDVIRNSNDFDDDEDDEDWFSAELPNGKARVRQNTQDNTDDGKVEPRFSEPLDILMENTGREKARQNSLTNETSANETHSGNFSKFDDESERFQVSQDESHHAEQFAPLLKNTSYHNDTNTLIRNDNQPDFDDDKKIDSGVRHNQNTSARTQEVRETRRRNIFTDSAEENPPLISAKKPAINQGDLFVADSEEEEDLNSTNDLPEEILSVNVIAKKGQLIDGQILLDAAQSFGLRFGDMDIFHRHENASGHGPVIFSMANAINPGTFNIDDLPEMQIKGVTFFMRLSTINKRVFVLELMVDIAKRLSNQLGAELKDDTHSVLSSQTVAHYKSRIQEYERRYLGQVLRK